MKPRRVVLSPEAADDLAGIYDWVSERASPRVAIGYLHRLERYLQGMSAGSERGRLRPDIRPGLRTVGFERRLTIAFVVDDEAVTILRVFGPGRAWEDELDDSDGR